MRVLHVIPTYLPAIRYGGTIFATHALCKALAVRGHEVHVYTTNLSGFGSERIRDSEAQIDGVNVHYFDSQLMQRLSFAPEMADALRLSLTGFDVLHLHSTYLWPTWVAARLAAKVGAPYVVSPRGMLVKKLIRHRNWLAKMAWISFAERRNFECASFVHVTSAIEARELAAFCWRFPEIKVIPNGIDPIMTGDGESQISRDVREATQRGAYALYFGRLSWKKGLERLLRAFAQTSEGTLVVAGTDDEGLSSRLRGLARHLNLVDRVRILSRTITGADKAYLYDNARLFVLASDSENFGNTVLEAMIAGIPVVTCPDVGAAEIVTLAGAGRVVPLLPAALAEAMTIYLDDATLANRVGAVGKEYALEHCSWAAVAAKMEELYFLMAERRSTNEKAMTTQEWTMPSIEHST